MVSSGALKDISTAYGTGNVTLGQKPAGTSGNGAEFAEAMRGTAAAKAEPAAAGEASVSFSAGAEVQRLGLLRQMKQTDFHSELFFSDDEDNAEDDMDSAISFDEIEELDRMSDIGFGQLTDSGSGNADGLDFELLADNEPLIFTD